MKHLNQAVSVNMALVLSVLIMAGGANASTPLCNRSLQLDLVSSTDCLLFGVAAKQPAVRSPHQLPAPEQHLPASGFQVNPTDTTGVVPKSALLLVVVGALLTLLSVRAKSCNTK